MLTNQLADLAMSRTWGGGLPLLLAKTTIILIAAIGITRAMHRASAGARHLVWLVTLVALLLVPGLTAWAPLELRVLPPSTVVSSMTYQPLNVAPRELEAISPQSAHYVAAASAGGGTALAPRATRPVFDSRLGSLVASLQAMSGIVLVAAIWAVVAVAILCSLAWSALAVRRIVRRAHAVDTEAWRVPLLEVADRLGLAAPPRLLVSRDTRMPFACGIFTPTIVLPEEGDDWPLDRRRAVLLHELAHVRRRDLPGHMLGRLVCAMYWFHPLVWMAAKRLRSESERACDDLALSCGTRATDYAEHLLDIVSAVRTNATPAVALAMARRKEFEGRMLAILDAELPHSTPSRRQSAALIASLALGASLVAAAAPAPRVAARPPAAPAIVAHRPAPSVPETTPPAALHEPPTMPREATRGPARRVAEPVVTTPGRSHETDAGPNTAAATPPATISGGASRAGPQSPDDRPALLAKVLRSDSSAKLRRIAAWGLQEYSESAAATDALINAVTHDADPSVREMAAWSLANYDHGHDVADVLAAALRGDRNENVRVMAAWALGTIGADASIDALTVALSDTSANVRTRAAWALGTIAPKRAPPALGAMLRDEDKQTRQLAAWTLFQIQDATALPALEAAFRTESDDETRLDYVRAISAMGEQSVDAIRALIESPDSRIKSTAVRALAEGHAAGPWPWPWPEPRPTPD